MGCPFRVAASVASANRDEKPLRRLQHSLPLPFLVENRGRGRPSWECFFLTRRPPQGPRNANRSGPRGTPGPKRGSLGSALTIRSNWVGGRCARNGP